MGKQDETDPDGTVRQWNYLRSKLPIIAWSMPLGAVLGVLVGVFTGNVSDSFGGALCMVAGAVVGLIVGVVLQLPVLLVVAIWKAVRGKRRAPRWGKWPPAK